MTTDLQASVAELLRLKAKRAGGHLYGNEVDAMASLAPALADALEAAEARIKHLEAACSKQNEEVCQTLGRALGYQRFADDQKNFPGSTNADGVCVGDVVAETLAMEAVRKIETLTTERDAALLEVDEIERLRAACRNAEVGLKMAPCGCSAGGGFVCTTCQGLREIRAVLGEDAGP